jgi:glycosyltransferase involved in cell wall biosynthesis
MPIRRALEPAALRHICRASPVSCVLHYGSFVPNGVPGRVSNVLCFTNLAPWGPGPDASTIRNRILRALFVRTAGRAKVIVVESHSTREFLCRLHPHLCERIVTLHNGYSTPEVELPAENGGFVVLGDIFDYRRIDVVVRAYARLEPEVRKRHPLTVIGSTERDAAAVARIRKAIAESGIEDSVHLLGRTARRDALVHVAAACAYVSHASVENGPNALVEAHAMGVPLVLSDLPVHRELTPHARFVSGEQELTAAFRSAAAAPQLGRRRVPSVNTWDLHVDQLGEILAGAGIRPSRY